MIGGVLMVGGAVMILSDNTPEEPLPLNRQPDVWYDAMIGGSAMTLSSGASEEPLNK